MTDQIPATPAPELPKPQRYITADECVRFLGLRNKSALTYLLAQPEPPPFIQLTSRSKVFSVPALVAWAEARSSTVQK